MSKSIQAKGDGGSLGLTLSMAPGSDPPSYSILPLTMKLKDGTTCKMSNMPTIEVDTFEKDAVDFDAKGELECEGGEKLSYELSVEKRG